MRSRSIRSTLAAAFLASVAFAGSTVATGSARADDEKPQTTPKTNDNPKPTDNPPQENKEPNQSGEETKQQKKDGDVNPDSKDTGKKDASDKSEKTDKTEKKEKEIPATSTATTQPPKNPIPNYDGRAPEGETAGDVALWVPRVLLYPFYFISQYLVRAPLGAALTWAERHEVPRLLYDFFAFGPDHKIGFAPVILFDFGFEPSVGLYFFWNDFIGKGNNLSVHGSTWGADWIAGGIQDRYQFNKQESLTLHVSGIARPDNQFYGTGATTILQNRSRYSATKLEAGAAYLRHFSKYSVLEAGVSERHMNFSDTQFYGDPSVDDSIAAGRFAAPEAYYNGYTAEVNHLRLAIDSRKSAPGSSNTGVHVEIEGEQGEAPDTNHAWIRYGAVVRGMLDVFAHNRTLSLSVGTFFSDPIGNNKVPFTELVGFGGYGPMAGFLPGRLWGRSGAVATVTYHWPIWMWLTGSLQASVGNVFDTHLDDFKPSLLRFSSAIGFSTLNETDNPLEMLVGIGSETFMQGATIDSLRIMVGTTHGY